MSIRALQRTTCTLAASFLLLLGVQAQSAAQDRDRSARITLTGQVVDEQDGQPIPFATVQIGAARMGVVADSLGRFRLNGVAEGVHLVTVTQLGYLGAEVEWQVVPENPPMLVPLVRSPVILAGVVAAVDRMERRRRAYASSVRVLDRARLADAVGQNALEVVRGRGNLTLMPCPGPGANQDCILHYGRPLRPAVYIDEVLTADGLSSLTRLAPHELYAIEIFGNGRQLRAYTVWFMDGLARRPGALRPIQRW